MTQTHFPWKNSKLMRRLKIPKVMSYFLFVCSVSTTIPMILQPLCQNYGISIHKHFHSFHLRVYGAVPSSMKRIYLHLHRKARALLQGSINCGRAALGLCVECVWRRREKEREEDRSLCIKSSIFQYGFPGLQNYIGFLRHNMLLKFCDFSAHQYPSWSHSLKHLQ